MIGSRRDVMLQRHWVWCGVIVMALAMSSIALARSAPGVNTSSTSRFRGFVRRTLQVHIPKRPLRHRRLVRRLRLMTYNIWGHRQYRGVRGRALLSILRRSRADVIALQEVSPWFLRHLKRSRRFRRWYRVGDDKQPTQVSGLYLLSRFPITSASFQTLPSGPELRGALVATVQVAGVPVRVVNTHLACFLEDVPLRIRQLKLLQALLKGSGEAFLLGDVNFGDGSPEVSHLPKGFVDVWKTKHPKKSGYTWDQARNPLARLHALPNEQSRRLDRIMLRGQRWRVQKSWRVGMRSLRYGRRRIFPSDHFGLVVQVKRIFPRCLPWRPAFQKAGLLLSVAARRRALQVRFVNGSPVPTSAQKRLARRYGRLLRQVEGLRRCLALRYRSLRSWRQRRRLLKRISRAAYELLEEAIMPLWLGTPWAFYGSAEAPHQKAIACGYFVTHMLKALGFRFPQSAVRPRRSDPKMREYEFAKLPSMSMMRLLSGPRFWRARYRRHSIRLVGKTLRRLGRGIYLLGLDYHVGLILYDGKRAHLWHSSSWVRRDDLFRSQQVLRSRFRQVAKIPLHSFVRWLKGRPVIVPVGWKR